MRQVVLDTETTGLEVNQGHRIIEIGCVEIVNRRLTGRRLHRYINPEREIDPGAIEIHGITDEFVRDKPVFSAIAEEFLEFVDGAELIIHNAPFDTGFLDSELARVDAEPAQIAARCRITDTLVLARDKHPGQRNNLDALCQRYHVDNSQRDLHGALLDAEILADVYLAMTGGQTALQLAGDAGENSYSTQRGSRKRPLPRDRRPLVVSVVSEAEEARHRAQLAAMAASRGAPTLWETLEQGGDPAA